MVLISWYMHPWYINPSVVWINNDQWETITIIFYLEVNFLLINFASSTAIFLSDLLIKLEIMVQPTPSLKTINIGSSFEFQLNKLITGTSYLTTNNRTSCTFKWCHIVNHCVPRKYISLWDSAYLCWEGWFGYGVRQFSSGGVDEEEGWGRMRLYWVEKVFVLLFGQQILDTKLSPPTMTSSLNWKSWSNPHLLWRR